MIPNELNLLFDGKVEPYDWYTWRLVSWGTKWDLSDETEVQEDFEDNKLEYRFDTAWSPPCAWVETASKKYPTLSFRLQYEEGGCSFEGHVTFKNGEAVDEYEGDYSRCYTCNKRGCSCTPAQKRGEEEGS